MNYARGLYALSLMSLVSLTSCFNVKESSMFHPLPRLQDYTVTINTLADVHNVYPTSVQAIESQSAYVMKHAQQIIDEFVELDSASCSKELLLQKLDAFCALVHTQVGVLELVQSVHPDKAVRDAAEKQSLALQAYSLEHFAANTKIYALTKAVYAQCSATCTPEEKHLFTDLLDSFKKAGLELLPEKRKQVLALKKELNDLDSEFSKNILSDTRTITATKQELAGVPERFISGLEQKDGVYTLCMDYPTADMVMGYCSVQETRKRFSEQFENRAYPANMSVLDTVIAKRAQMAELLGYASYAHYNIDGQTMQTPEKAWAFERGLVEKSLEKAMTEFAAWKQSLPAGVTLSPTGKLYPWDVAYTQNHFKKAHYAIDEQEFAEYFPMENTVKGLIAIYEQFFNLVITHVDPGTAWHKEVELLQISDMSGKVLGYVYLDMFPRPNKYNHAAQFSGISSVKRGNVWYPAVVALVCNFTKPVGDTPSLLKYSEVVTFFHEFGHAIHSVLGATEYGMQSGTNTERDFVELPSQMLENWMEEAEILKMISSHYKTGKPLSDDLIEKRLALLRSETGMFVSRQLSLGMICLDMFDGAPHKDTSACIKKYSVMMSPYKEYSDDAHMQCSFGHLMGYGASYYGYMWALVRGTDVFAQIKKEGLLNPAAGKRYVNCIIGRGGSIDGNTMVKDYLGREATYDAFYEKMGF